MNNYTDFGWENAAATEAHDYLFPQVIQLLGDRKDKTILDVGCGNGATVSRLIEQGFDVWGIDASESGIDIANKRHPGRFFVQDVSSEELPIELRDKCFEIIISTEVIEHVYSPRAYMRFIKSVLANSGGGGRLSFQHPTMVI